MKTDLRLCIHRVLRWGGLTMLLLLVACHLPFSTPRPPTATALPPAVYEPASGIVMRWIDTSDFIYVPPGEFTMGEDKPGGGDEAPAHKVTLGGFWIQQTEVTNKMYAGCVALGICTPPSRESGSTYWYEAAGHGDDPVVGVDWNQAQTYCKWIEGALPTEAQWEKTARGTEAKPYPWGEADPTCNLLNFKGCLDPSRTNRVRSYPQGASPYNAADTAGNVFEWVNDWYAADYYTQSPAADPPGPAAGELRVTRSSSYRSLVGELKVTQRWPQKPESHRADLGFRCVLTGETVANPPPQFCQAAALPEPPSAELPRLSATVVSYCEGTSEDPNPGFNVTARLDPPLEWWWFDIGRPDIRCDPIPGEEGRFNCHGRGVRQNETVTLDLCPMITGPGGVMLCPPGYDHSGPVPALCYYNPYSTGGGCREGAMEVPGLGCIPLPSEGACPAGYYYYTTMTHEYCIPLGRYCSSRGAEATAVPECGRCPEGSIFQPEQGCCSLPREDQPVCAFGYEYHSNPETGAWVCMPSVPCLTVTADIPACPTPTTPPPPSCYCCQFTSQTECNQHSNNGCIWTGSSCTGP